MILKTSIKNRNTNTSLKSLQKSQAVISNRRFPFDFNGDNTMQNDSIYVQFEKAIEGKMKCIYFAGQNPMVSNPNLGNVHRGLRKLDTVIVEDLYLNETASFRERLDKKIIWWDAAAEMWKGYDRPDVESLTAAPDTPAGQKLFRMVGEGVGKIFAASYNFHWKKC